MGVRENWLKNQKKKKKEQEKNYSVSQAYKQKNGVSLGPVGSKNTWFQNSALFEDGWQFGDLTKTILGTLTDAAENSGAGALGTGEKVADFIAMIAQKNAETQTNKMRDEALAISDRQRALSGQGTSTVDNSRTSEKYDNVQKSVNTETADFVKKDLYNEQEIAKKIISAPIKNITGIDSEATSVFGEKSDSLLQSGGQMGVQLALNSILPGSGMGLMFATSYGSQAEQALNEGATIEQAQASALISAGAEVLSEKLSGGIKFGGKTLDDVIVKPLLDKISNKAVKSLIEVGVDTAGEGFEEVFSEFFTNLGTALYKEDDLEDILFSEEALDGYLDSFIGGALLGNVSSSVSHITNRNAVELTENEQAVFDRVVEKSIEEIKKDGKKVSKTEEKAIRQDVFNKLQKGYIDISTIEEVLGGDDYKTYTDLKAKEDSLTKEYDELGTKTNPTLSEQKRFDELDAQLKALKNDTNNADSYKTKVSSAVAELVKDSRLQESYNERDRRKNAFTADLSKYNENQRATVQKAIDSGILNNTNRTHEFVDMIAKISADKGVPFDFTNNERLKESSLALDGKVVNGYVQNGTVTVNTNSVKALNSVVGHEITHVFEGTELYDSLKDSIIKYAKDIGEYDAKLQSITKLYEGTDADIQKEVVADLVGDYLFTDEKFVRNLSVNNRNVFQKVYDEIKYLCKVATSGSKEARQLEKVKKTFEQIYRESTQAEKNTTNESGVRYSMSGVNSNDFKSDINNLEIIDISNNNELSSRIGDLRGAQKYKVIQKYILDVLSEQPIKMSDGKLTIVDRSDALHIANKSANKKTAQISQIKQLVEKAQLYAEDYNTEHNKFNYFCYYKVDVNFEGDIFPLYINVGKAKNNGKYHIYDITNKIRDTANRINGLERPKPNEGYALTNDISTGIISNSNGNVNSKSLSEANSHPIKRGNYNIMGEDVTLTAPMQMQNNDKSNDKSNDFAPLNESIQKNKTAVNMAPVREDITKKNNAIVPDGFTIIDETQTEKDNTNVAEDNTTVIGDILPKGDFKRLISSLSKTLSLTKNEKEVISDIVQKYSTEDLPNNKKLFDEIKEKFSERSYTERNNEIADIKNLIKGYKFAVSEYIKRDITDYSYFKKRNYGKLNLSNGGMPVDTAYMELSSMYPEYFPDDIANPSDQLQKIAEVANMSNKQYVNETLDDEVINDATNQIVIEVQKMKKKSSTPEYKRSIQAQKKHKERFGWIKVMVGDTTNWKDKKIGLSYQINTEKRNLRDIIRKSDGTRDIEKADEINNAFQGAYNHDEAILKRVSNQIKKKYADLKITRAEDPYIQMLGEFRYNPDTKLTQADIDEYYAKHKKKIDIEKVDKIIEMARKDYDELITQVNAVLRENGMKEIPYRKGYFPHFVEDKQSPLAKLLNLKTHKDDIPTDIAGLTEQFNPNRSWQSFNKQRQGDTTDYSFTKGFDTYLHGALDWIYHIDDIQNRRALENYIRYTHSDKGIQDRIDELNNGDVNYDADEYQKQVDLIFKEAQNPLNNFLIDFRTKTNTLANKKSTLDRDMETMLNREVYSISTNIFNRVTANHVVGSVSSALTNFIPITQSWGQVSPVRSLQAMREVIKNAIHDDGTIDKSDFLTNRLKPEENLYKTNWDKVSNGLSLMMDVVDNFTSQVVWRSKYADNMHKGMSEVEAIKNADQFAENVIAGRSRGNMPTAFDSKNPLVKIFTAFQLEVNNQYGYMLKDMPQDMRNESKLKLIKGYATMFIGANLYNALYSSITGRDAAFDPIKIIHELLKDIFDDDEEDPAAKGKNIILNFTDDVLEEVPFIGGLLGGGRIPISSALPYGEGVKEAYDNTVTDFTEGNWQSLTKEWLNPLFYLLLPMGGGQLKKTHNGLKMFDNENIVPGSYTDSGNLRFPVEDTLANRVQAGIFGQYANKNAREYFDKNFAPLKPEYTEEYSNVDMSIQDYRKYRDEVNSLETVAEKFDYVSKLDLPDAQKNYLINNLVDRDEAVDISNYSDFGSYEEFEFYNKNPEKRTVAKAVGGYDSFYYYKNRMNSFTADKDTNGNAISGSRKNKVLLYINSLDIDYGHKIILYRSQYKSDDTYNYEIVDYLNQREDISYEEMVTILQELDMNVDSQGNVTW